MKTAWVILTALVVVLAVAAGYLGYTYFGIKNSASPLPEAASQTPQAPTSYTGVIEPIPNLPGDTFQDSDGNPSGLKTDNGDYYALVGLTDKMPITDGERVTVYGQIDPSVTFPHLNIKGGIRVTELKPL